jgi:hypothetical protein
MRAFPTIGRNHPFGNDEHMTLRADPLSSPKLRSPSRLSFQSLAQRLRRLPSLFVADVRVAHGGADILVPEELLDFPQIFSHLIEQDRRRAVAQPVGCDLPHPERSASGPQPQVERAIGKRLARISRKHKLRRREGDSAGSHDPAAFKFLLEGLPLEERRTQAPRDGHILEDASLALDPESDDFLPHPLAI